jgi:nucleotide-binding universal stress UspA family protein
MRVLLATKGSTHSEIAVQMLLELARTLTISATVLTVIKDKGEAETAATLMSQTATRLGTAVADVQTRLRMGDAAAEILREASEGRYDLILTGRRAAHSMLRRILGSVTQHLLTKLPCPLLIAKERARPIRTVLLCDSGEFAPPLLQRLVDSLPELLQDVHITCLHVMSQISARPGLPGEQLRAAAEDLIKAHAPEGEWLQRDSRILAGLEVTHDLKVRHGLVVDEIAAEARGGDYDVVVIGAHRGMGWAQLMLDNLARQIVAEVDRPVLIIP